MKEMVLTHSSVALPSGRDFYKLNRRLIWLQGWDGDFGEESTLLHFQQLALNFPADYRDWSVSSVRRQQFYDFEIKCFVLSQWLSDSQRNLVCILLYGLTLHLNSVHSSRQDTWNTELTSLPFRHFWDDERPIYESNERMIPLLKRGEIYFSPVALWPNAGHGLLILEVSWSHTTTHHSR